MEKVEEKVYTVKESVINKVISETLPAYSEAVKKAIIDILNEVLKDEN